MGELNLHHLFVFHAVARTGSFTRAAEELFITQPAVSKQVHQLERDLRTVLVGQAGRQIYLTQAGELLAGYAATIFSMAEDASRAMAELQNLERGTLTVAASETIGMYLLPGVARTFLARYPGVLLRLQVMNTHNVVEALTSYQAEVGFIEGPVSDGQLALQQIALDELVLVAAAGGPFHNETSIEPAQLVGMPFVLREPGSGTRAVADAFLEAAGVQPRIVAEIDNIEAVKRVVAESTNLTVLSVAAIAGEVAAGRAVALRLAGVEMARPLSIATLPARKLSRAAQAFIVLAAEAVPRMLGENAATLVGEG